MQLTIKKEPEGFILLDDNDEALYAYGRTLEEACAEFYDVYSMITATRAEQKIRGLLSPTILKQRLPHSFASYQYAL